MEPSPGCAYLTGSSVLHSRAQPGSTAAVPSIRAALPQSSPAALRQSTVLRVLPGENALEAHMQDLTGAHLPCICGKEKGMPHFQVCHVDRIGEGTINQYQEVINALLLSDLQPKSELHLNLRIMSFMRIRQLDLLSAHSKSSILHTLASAPWK